MLVSRATVTSSQVRPPALRSSPIMFKRARGPMLTVFPQFVIMQAGVLGGDNPTHFNAANVRSIPLLSSIASFTPVSHS